MDCSLPDSSVHGILQAGILGWVAFPFSRGIFPTQGSSPGLPLCRWILYHLSPQGSPISHCRIDNWLNLQQLSYNWSNLLFIPTVFYIAKQVFWSWLCVCVCGKIKQHRVFWLGQSRKHWSIPFSNSLFYFILSTALLTSVEGVYVAEVFLSLCHSWHF